MYNIWGSRKRDLIEFNNKVSDWKLKFGTSKKSLMLLGSGEFATFIGVVKEDVLNYIGWIHNVLKYRRSFELPIETEWGASLQAVLSTYAIR